MIVFYCPFQLQDFSPRRRLKSFLDCRSFRYRAYLLTYLGRVKESMCMPGKHIQSKGVSQVIAALLVIAVTIAGAVLLYVFAIGVIGNLSSGVGQQVKDQVTMVSYNFPVGGPLSITVKNVGSSPVDLATADFFINGVSATSGSECKTTLTIGGSCTIALSPPGGYGGLLSGYSYTVKIVTADGAIFSYSVTYGGGS